MGPSGVGGLARSAKVMLSTILRVTKMFLSAFVQVGTGVVLAGAHRGSNIAGARRVMVIGHRRGSLPWSA